MKIYIEPILAIINLFEFNFKDLNRNGCVSPRRDEERLARLLNSWHEFLVDYILHVHNGLDIIEIYGPGPYKEKIAKYFSIITTQCIDCPSKQAFLEMN